MSSTSDVSPAPKEGDSFDVLIIGAGPSGAAAAVHAARAGLKTLLVDAASFPRDKTCGDGLTPRAMHQLENLGVADQLLKNYSNKGLKLHGFGGSVTAPWPSSYPTAVGSAMARHSFDELLFRLAQSHPEVSTWENATAEEPIFKGSRLAAVRINYGGVSHEVAAGHVIVADGVRSTFGKKLGRVWHRNEVYGIAARSYCTSPKSDEPWMHSHVELRDEQGVVQPGYGWIFPLGDGTVNLGCGALSTDKRPARINTKKLLSFYAAQQREEWGLGEEQHVTSALLPMGGAVSNVAGSNWMLIGDSAACVNPLNGEGIDYGLETAALAVETLSSYPRRDLTLLWPHILREHYGETFLLARTAARLLTYPQFLPITGPLAFRGPLQKAIMPAAARLMGNLITPEDKDLLARGWRLAGSTMQQALKGAPLWSSTI
ncbi:geranylgeranyl reductase family protein [Corynebacterium callunae]|uniref:Monooxygenase, FAD-binding protein n=1 Tax=Corynebacterium callunae DSM 20147 TaxID=1121353 RepID=M1US07_9CORY|nr:geranylgeranyl reductase family protein [Corynebacterium callunae]AGG65857.1 monooxygenase, FAD-binding protein [Corynebacterium callunae DSM 20147]